VSNLQTELEPSWVEMKRILLHLPPSDVADPSIEVSGGTSSVEISVVSDVNPSGCSSTSSNYGGGVGS
jgi:hypothetical protein